MCDRCRWNDHEACRGWLGQGQRLRCLCRSCLDQRLARVTDVTERALRPGRPQLVLILGGAEPRDAGSPSA